ncbi:hypothetical protein LPJ61_005347, partial [Coemansia biformis]
VLERWLPRDVIVWCDPYNVTYRIGDHGTVYTVFEDKRGLLESVKKSVAEKISRPGSDFVISPYTTPVVIRSADGVEISRRGGASTGGPAAITTPMSVNSAVHASPTKGANDLRRSAMSPLRHVSTFRPNRSTHSGAAGGEGQLPLAGIRVLDLTRVLAGPFCTMMLGDLGAEVIKVEHPQRGDDTRAWGPPFKEYVRAPAATGPTPPYAQPPPPFPGESAYYLCVNRNKQSVTIDMKCEAGRQIVRELARRADVLVENFVPGKLAAMGLGYENLRRENRGLVYASISGYGATGPYRTRPGYDVIVEAEAGLMHITGEEGGPPVKVGVAVTDIVTGLHTHSAILAALLARQRTGHGQHLDASLLQAQTSLLANVASNYLIGGQEAKRWGTRHASIAPYQVFATADGAVCIGAGNDTQFASLCAALDLRHLAVDPRFATNAARVASRATLIPLLEAAVGRRSTSDVLRLLEGRGMPFGPVNNIAQTFDHPQVHARGIVRQIDHPFVGPIRVVGPAVEYSAGPPPRAAPPPMLGQHTEHVLRAVLGYSDQQVAAAAHAGGVVVYGYNR